jgi:hypothetical protein
MTDRSARLDDDALGGALRDLATAIEWPVASAVPGGGPDLATRVRVRLQDAPVTPPRAGWRPARRAVILALVALLALAAVAGAVGLGLPGLRMFMGSAPGSSPPTISPSAPIPSGPPGSTLGLGKLTALPDLDAAAGRHIALPTDPLLGPPDAAYVDVFKANQVALVWAPRPHVPATLDPGVGLLLMSFDGLIEDEYYAKFINSGATLVPTEVGGMEGYWFSGAPHVFFYDRTGGGFVDDDRRWVGQALVWSDGTITYRIETSLPEEDAIRIATSLE